MVDPENLLDPVDTAYADAEALLTDDGARAARRARILAQIAQDVAAQPIAPLAPRQRSPWRNGGWLAAASVVGLSVFVASRLQPPSPTAAPAPKVASTVGAVTTDAAPRPPSLVAAQPDAAPTDQEAAPRVAAKTAPPPLAFAAPPRPAPNPESMAANDATSPRVEAARDEALSDRAAASPAGPRTQESGNLDAPAMPRGTIAPLRAAPQNASTLVAKPGLDLAQRLRAAAAAGRTAEVEDLLAQGVPVDAPDADGDTALMKSVAAGRMKTAVLLRRHGASLDKKNRAGASARDIARAKNKADLTNAIGTEP